MKITHFRCRDTGKTGDLTLQGKGIVPFYLIEVRKGKKWVQWYDGGEACYGYGLEQTIANLRFILHWKKTVHAYQIEGVDPSPLIAIPEGYRIERLFHRGDKSYEHPRYYFPRPETGMEDFDRVFPRYTPALEYLRRRVGPQEFEYDFCDITS